MWQTSNCDKSKEKTKKNQIGSAVAGFNHGKTITKASATDLQARKDYYNKRIWSPGSIVNNPVR